MNVSDALRPWYVRMCVTLCVMTVNESSTTLNMILAIYDVKLEGHGPHATKCSVSWSNPVVLILGKGSSRGHKITLEACNMIYEARNNTYKSSTINFFPVKYSVVL